MYNYGRSCWMTVLVLPTQAFQKPIIETSNIHKLFIQYPHNAYFIAFQTFQKMGKRLTTATDI